MENENKIKPRVKHPDRVSLSPEALNRLGNWMAELEGRMKGSRITKSDLVNFLLLSHPASLSEREIELVAANHFDEVRFAAWALAEVKKAKAQGKNLSLSDVIGLGATSKQKGGLDGGTCIKPSK